MSQQDLWEQEAFLGSLVSEPHHYGLISGDISYSFWSRPFYNENNPEIIKTSVWSNVLIILLR